MVKDERYDGFEQAVRYDRHTKAKRPDRWLSHGLELLALRRALNGVSAERVLDAPCGTGRIHSILTEKFPAVVSLDSSESMLRVHNANAPSGMVCQGDVFHLPFAENQFDWVICHRLFHHLQDGDRRARLLSSFGRVGRNGVVFTAWIETPFNRRRGSRRRSLPISDVNKAAVQSGLRVSRVCYAAWPFQPKAVVIARKDRT